MTADRLKFKAILFDLDGTLLDTLQDIADSANFALSQLGLATHSIQDYKYFVGGGIETAIRRILPESRRDEGTVARCLELNQAQYHRCWPVHTRPYSGIVDMLTELQNRDIPMAILSNKPHEFVREMVGRILEGFRFHVVRGAKPGVPVKPDPTAAMQIAGRMKISPAQFIYLGDSDTDMQTAGAAGMYAVGALWGFRTADELTRAGAKRLIEEPGEVVGLFDDDR